MSEEQKANLQADRSNRLEALAAARQAEQEVAIANAKKYLERSTDFAKIRSDYFEKKGLVEAQNLSELKYDLKEERILIPAYDKDGNLQSIQNINQNGGKFFEKGCPKAGAIHLIAPNEKGESPKALAELESPKSVLIAEGYTTGASLHLATGQPVVVAFTAGNLPAAARAVREVYAEAEIVLCADNDHQLEKNVGLQKAEEAAKEVGGRVATPPFSREELPKGFTDFNDLHQSQGLKAVREAIQTKDLEQSTKETAAAKVKQATKGATR